MHYLALPTGQVIFLMHSLAGSCIAHAWPGDAPIQQMLHQHSCMRGSMCLPWNIYVSLRARQLQAVGGLLARAGVHGLAEALHLRSMSGHSAHPGSAWPSCACWSAGR